MARNNFTLTLDTLAPEGSISVPAAYVNSTANTAGDPYLVEIDHGDAVLMKCWLEKFSQSGPTSIPTNWEPAATMKEISFPQGEGYYYAHLILRDEVGNESEIITSETGIIYDTTKPIISNVMLSDPDSGSSTLVNEYSLNITFKYEDALSGCSEITVYGDKIETLTITAEGDGEYNGTLNIYDWAEDGDVTVYISAIDNAGNEFSTESAGGHTITLDTKMDALTLSVKDSDSSLSDYDWTNESNLELVVESSDTDIVEYAIWIGEDSDIGNAEWKSYTGGSDKFYVSEYIDLYESEEIKLTAAARDTSGNTVVSLTRVISIDTSAPVVEIFASPRIISHVEGFNTVSAYYEADCSLSGEREAVYEINGSVYTGDVSAIPSTSFVEGDNTIKVIVTDKAGNSSEASIDVTLDTAAPSSELDGTLNVWYNTEEPFNIRVRHSDAHEVVTMYAWTDTSKTNTVIPEGTKAITVVNNPQEITAKEINWGLVESATNYLHVAVVDEVGNIGYLLTTVGEERQPHSFGWDKTAPTGSVKFEKGIYNTRNAYVILDWADNVSGVTQVKLDGDITTIDWENVPTESKKRSVTLSEGDNIKTINVYYRDAAGNESAQIVGLNTTELDMSKPSASIVLYKKDGVTAKPGVSSEVETTVKISYTDTDARGTIEYKLYGDFEESSDEWVVFSADKGTDTKSILVKALASQSEEKVARTFNVVVRDNAGNESPVASASFYLNSTPADAEVEDLDHNRISTVHVYRDCTNPEHPVGDSYADEVKFFIKPSDIIVEYKVCAYADFAAANAGTQADEAIPMTNGSVHMSGSTNSSDRIDCMIRGKDYEAALGISEAHEGAHVVVVYVKDEAGNWSKGYMA